MRLTDKVHQILSAHLHAGDLAIDATAGNGHDTLFLAKQVAPCGKVIAIDIQAAAIESTRERLEAANLEASVELHIGDHAEQLEQLVNIHANKVAAITFNLGYLPGSNHSIQTQAESTVSALNASLQLLEQEGRLCVTAYRGHAGGLEEANLVSQWIQQKEKSGHSIESYTPASQNNPPILWALKKL